MISVSREPIVKIARHAWNVYPLEAFGYLLGRSESGEILAALPFSKTSRWYEYDDQWVGIDENYAQAESLGDSYGLEVVGYYCSEVHSGERYSRPSFLERSTMGILCVYSSVCCPSCSWVNFTTRHEMLSRNADYQIAKGKRLVREVNQGRIYTAWLGRVGQIDYSNGYQDKSQDR